MKKRIFHKKLGNSKNKFSRFFDPLHMLNYQIIRIDSGLYKIIGTYEGIRVFTYFSIRNAPTTKDRNGILNNAKRNLVNQVLNKLYEN